MTPRDEYTRNATILYWHDADTCRVLIDLGYYTHQKAWIRLNGYDAPEKGKAGYVTTFARVNVLAPAGSLVVVQTLKPLAKSFDRWIGNVWPNLAPGLEADLSAILTAEHLTKADFL